MDWLSTVQNKGIPCDELPTSDPDTRVQTSEVVKLMLDTLHSLGYEQAALTLQQESGVTFEQNAVQTLRDAVLEGDWDKALLSLNSVPWRRGEEIPLVAFALCRQQYLEALQRDDTTLALRILHDKLYQLCELVRFVMGLPSLAQGGSFDPLFAATPVFPPLHPTGPPSSDAPGITTSNPRTFNKQIAKTLVGKRVVDKFFLGPADPTKDALVPHPSLCLPPAHRLTATATPATKATTTTTNTTTSYGNTSSSAVKLVAEGRDRGGDSVFMWPSWSPMAQRPATTTSHADFTQRITSEQQRTQPDVRLSAARDAAESKRDTWELAQGEAASHSSSAVGLFVPQAEDFTSDALLDPQLSMLATDGADATVAEALLYASHSDDDVDSYEVQSHLRPAKKQRTAAAGKAGDTGFARNCSMDVMTESGAVTFFLPEGFMDQVLHLDEEEARHTGASNPNFYDAIASTSYLHSMALHLLLGMQPMPKESTEGNMGRMQLLHLIERRLAPDVIPPFRLLSLLGQAMSQDRPPTATQKSRRGPKDKVSLLHNRVEITRPFPRRVLSRFAPHGGKEVWQMAASCTGQKLATASGQGEFCIWDVSSLKGLSMATCMVADGSNLASCKIKSGTWARLQRAAHSTEASGEGSGRPEKDPDIGLSWSRDGAFLAVFERSAGNVYVLTASGHPDFVCETGSSGISGVVWTHQTSTRYKLACSAVDGGIWMFEFEAATTRSTTKLASIAAWATPGIGMLEGPQGRDGLRESCYSLIVALCFKGSALLVNTADPAAPMLEQALPCERRRLTGLRVDNDCRYVLIGCSAVQPVPSYKPGTLHPTYRPARKSRSARTTAMLPASSPLDVAQHGLVALATAAGGVQGGVAGELEEQGCILLWDLVTSTLVRKYQGHVNHKLFLGLDFAGDDGDLVVAGSENCRAYVWQKDSGQLLHMIPTHAGPVTSVHWLNDADAPLLTASDDGTVTLWRR